MMSTRQIYSTVDVQIVPTMALIDHTFRFYEPEESHYAVRIPPFIQMNQPGITIDMSHPQTKADVL
jgi:hypothetical protein